MIIRKETESDIGAIFEITKKAFENHPYSNNTEQFIVNALRDDSALTLSLVAEVDGAVVGHVAFSPVTISDGSKNWYALGPLSVIPTMQKQGIGKALVTKGLALLKANGAQGCVLVGEPGYYGRFGFENIPGLVMEGVPDENVLTLSFTESKVQGTVTHHPGFYATS